MKKILFTLFLAGNVYASSVGQETSQISSPVAAKDTVVVSDSISRQVSDSIIPANKIIEDLDTTIFYVECDPQFPGGEAALNSFIAKNLKYPAFAAKNGIQGRVILSFSVESDGSIGNIEVMRSPADELSREAIRVLKSMPRWRPGMQRGKAVRVKYTLPFTFRLGPPRKNQPIKAY